MTHNVDEFGPVDYLVIEFPAGQQNFTGEVLEQLLALIDAGTIRLLDLSLIAKEEDGTIDVLEISELGELGPLVAYETQLAALLAAEYAAPIAALQAPGSVAGVVIYENLWAAGFGAAARRAGGQLVGNGRIPTQAIIAALEAGDE